MNSRFVLMILPDDEMAVALRQALQEHSCPFDFEILTTVQDARKVLSKKETHAIVMTRSIALSGDDGTNGLVKLEAILPPTVTLIYPGDDFPDYLYSPFCIHDWITVPFDVQEICHRALFVIERAKEKRIVEIATKIQLIAALKDSNQRAEAWFGNMPAKDFFTRQGDVWSASDNVDHLIKAVKPVAKALKLPKFTLQAMFGKPEKPSMAYEELCQIYRDAIANGAQASGRYLPNQESPGEAAQTKKQILLDQWSKANTELLSVVEKWDDEDLDQYLLPHPLIGKLTIREMIFFTIYHNLRHASLEGD